jgi:hypothetical protein
MVQEALLSLDALIPERRHREFVSGVIERAEEEGLITQPTGGPLTLGEFDA